MHPASVGIGINVKVQGGLFKIGLARCRILFLWD